MASWMVHLRVADSLLDQIPGLSQAEFIVGNIACVRHDEEGNFISIHPEDIPAIENALVPIKDIILVDGNTVFITYPADCLPKWGGDVVGY